MIAQKFVRDETNVEVITAHHFTPLHMKLAMQSNMPLNSQN
jgi:hypothetical protein